MHRQAASSGMQDPKLSQATRRAQGPVFQMVIVSILMLVVTMFADTPTSHYRSTPRKEVILDTPTRWNSTHAMIERASELRVPLSELAKTIPDLPELSDED